MRPPVNPELVTFVHPIPESASPRDVLESLKRDAVAILVGEGGRPAGVLTLSDLGHIRERIDAKAERARDVFHHGRDVYKVGAAEDAAAMARAIARHQLKTGIVAVDDEGRYAGYVFVRDLRTLRDELHRRSEELESKMEQAQQRFPEQFARVGRILRSGGDPES